MTVPAAERKAGPFNGNGSTTEFPFDFKVFTTADIEVVFADTDGVETVLELDSDYSVSLNSDQDATPGGTVTYPISGDELASGEKLSIAGALAYEQETDIPTGGNFNPTVLENALDKLSMQTQQLAESVSRAAKVPITNAADADTLTQAILVAANNIAGLEIVVANISDIQTVADDLNEATSEINTVAVNIANVNTVGNNITNVGTVAGISSNVTTVAGISANVTTVAGIASAVSAVAGNATNVNAVAAIDDDVTTIATNIAAVLDAPTQATAAASSASAAAASAAAAALSYDSFDDRYLGAKNSAPSADNDGNALVSGAMYFNTGVSVADDKGMWIYDGGTWIQASAASQAILVRYKYVATAAQTTFTGTDANGLTLSYTAGSIIVTLNGVVMDAADYTATNGNSVVLASGAAASDEVCVFAFSTFDIANTYTQSQVDAFAVKLTGTQTVAGAKTFSSDVTIQKSGASDNSYFRSKNADREYAFGVRGSVNDNFEIYDITADVSRLAIDTSGRVTMPYQPHARASRNSGSIGGNSVIVFNYADENIAGMYNTANGRFTAPVAGRYLFSHGIFSAVGSDLWLAFRVNGVNIQTTYSTAGGYSSVAGGIVLTMNAGDYADLYVNGASYTAYGGDRSQCWATFTLLG